MAIMVSGKAIQKAGGLKIHLAGIHRTSGFGSMENVTTLVVTAIWLQISMWMDVGLAQMEPGVDSADGNWICKMKYLRALLYSAPFFVVFFPLILYNVKVTRLLTGNIGGAFQRCH